MRTKRFTRRIVFTIAAAAALSGVAGPAFAGGGIPQNEPSPCYDPAGNNPSEYCMDTDHMLPGHPAPKPGEGGGKHWWSSCDYWYSIGKHC